MGLLFLGNARIMHKNRHVNLRGRIMSKTGWIILIVCLALVLCITLGLLLAGRIFSFLLSKGSETRVDESTTKSYKDLKNDFSADGVYSVEMKDLKKLHVDWISGSVTVELIDGDAIRFQETADKTIKEKDALRFGTSGGTLRIQACKKGHIGNLPRKDLTVYLPRSLADGLQECEIDTVSGRVKLNDMRVEEAQVDTVSGQGALLDCSFDSLRFDSVSGTIKVSGSAKKVKASSVSGEVDLTLADPKEIKISTMSGPITLDLAAAPKDLDIDTTSGKTRLTLPQDASCTITLDAMSGKLYLNDEAVSSKEITLGNGAASYDIDSMSGSVYVITK